MEETDKKLITTEHDKFIQYSQYLTPDCIWRADAYLLIGTRRAVLFDVLAAECDIFKDVMRRIGDLPLDVVISHGHYDHAGSELQKFINAGYSVFINYEDAPALYAMYGSGYYLKDFVPMIHGQIFDIGNRTLKMLQVAGHSPGSMVMLDEDNELLFSADALGAGETQVQVGYESVTLERYGRDLMILKQEVMAMPDLTIWSGHSNMVPDGMSYEFLDILLFMVDSVVKGKAEGEPYIRPGEALLTTRRLCSGGVTLLYNDHRIHEND